MLSCNIIQIHSLHRRYVPEYIPCSHVIAFNSCTIIPIHTLHRRYVPDYVPCSHVISFKFIHCTGDMYLSTSRALMCYPSCSYTAHPCSHFRFVQMDFKRVTTPVGWFDIWLFEPRYGPTTIDCPYLMVRKLNPPIAVTWTIAQCEEDPDKYVADFVNALSGRRITCVILLASKGYTVFKTLRYLTFIFSRLKQCSPFQKYVSGMPGVDEDDIMINTDVQGVVTVE